MSNTEELAVLAAELAFLTFLANTGLLNSKQDVTRIRSQLIYNTFQMF
ncbi:MAG: hypothetical protein L0I85_07545 [Staphylococcus equorum]|nr:hypothetical protein [Staphylococcus equorum]